MDPRHDKARNKELFQKEARRKRAAEAARRYGPMLERLEEHRVGLLIMGGERAESGQAVGAIRKHIAAGYELPASVERDLQKFEASPLGDFEVWLPDLMKTILIGLDPANRSYAEALLKSYERTGWSNQDWSLARAIYEKSLL